MPKKVEMDPGQLSFFDQMPEMKVAPKPEPKTKAKAKVKTEPKVETEPKVKTKPEPRSRGRGKTEPEKKAENRKIYRRYLDIKKEAIEAEKHNSSQLILFPNSDIDTNQNKYDFYNMGGNSAILYVHEYSRRIGRDTAVLREDGDVCKPEERFPNGVAIIRGLDSFKEKMEKIGVKYAGSARGLYFFDLPKEYSRREIKTKLKKIREQKDQMNALIYATVLYPDIHKQILVLERMVPAKVKNMENAYREVAGMEMMRALMGLINTYSRMTHGDIDQMTAARKMLNDTDTMCAVISLLVENRLWDVTDGIMVGQTVVNIQQLVRGRIINKEKHPKTDVKEPRKRYEQYNKTTRQTSSEPEKEQKHE